jgi:hypothetical protein
MALVKKSIIGSLESKRTGLNQRAEASVSTAKMLEQQIVELRVEATTSTKQAKAIDEALGILSAAGVEV